MINNNVASLSFSWNCYRLILIAFHFRGENARESKSIIFKIILTRWIGGFDFLISLENKVFFWWYLNYQLNFNYAQFYLYEHLHQFFAIISSFDLHNFINYPQWKTWTRSTLPEIMISQKLITHRLRFLHNFSISWFVWGQFFVR